MVFTQVQVEQALVTGRVPAHFTHVELGAPLLVAVALLDIVDLAHVRLEGAALRERLVAAFALVWTNTCVSAHMPLQVKGIIESFSAKVAHVLLLVIVAFEMSVEHPLEIESFFTDWAAICIRLL